MIIARKWFCPLFYLQGITLSVLNAKKLTKLVVETNITFLMTSSKQLNHRLNRFKQVLSTQNAHFRQPHISPLGVAFDASRSCRVVFCLERILPSVSVEKDHWFRLQVSDTLYLYGNPTEKVKWRHVWWSGKPFTYLSQTKQLSVVHNESKVCWCIILHLPNIFPKNKNKCGLLLLLIKNFWIKIWGFPSH